MGPWSSRGISYCVVLIIVCLRYSLAFDSRTLMTVLHGLRSTREHTYVDFVAKVKRR